MPATKREAPICIMCMEQMGRKCTLPDAKAKHQDAVAALEKHLANREPHKVGKDLSELVIQVEATKGCIETREEMLGITKG